MQDWGGGGDDGIINNFFLFDKSIISNYNEGRGLDTPRGANQLSYEALSESIINMCTKYNKFRYWRFN